MTFKPISAVSSGRLDVMGGIADYSGALVLQMPIAEHTTVTLKNLRNDLHFTVKSDDQYCEIDYDDLLQDGKVDYGFARQYFYKNHESHWASYVLGCVLVLHKEKNIVPIGFDIEIMSEVPIGKGLSSSAALEVATMKTLSQYYDLAFSGTELPVLTQRVENLIVGAPCGLMDQLACYFGKPNELLPIVCQPDILQPTLKIPEHIKFVGIDSGVRHSVGGASYTDVRTAAFMGLKIIRSISASKIDYLANISVDDFEKKYTSILPKTILGSDFIEKYGSTSDSVTTVKPDVVYAVYQATIHPIYEQQRITMFAKMLSSSSNGANNNTGCNPLDLGKLMYQSHKSYSACGLGSEATDRIVELAKKHQKMGIYGAKITGGGSGGTVCILCDAAIETTELQKLLSS